MATKIQKGNDLHVRRQLSALIEDLIVQLANLTIQVNSLVLNGIRKIDQQNTDLTVVNTAAETDIYSFAVNNADFTGKTLRLTIGGIYTNNTILPQTITLKLYFGASVVYQDATLSLPLSLVGRAWGMTFNLQSRSATQQIMQGLLGISGLDGAAVGVGGLGLVASLIGQMEAESTVNTGTPGTTTIRLAVQHSAASAALSLVRRNVTLELM